MLIKNIVNYIVWFVLDSKYSIISPIRFLIYFFVLNNLPKV